MNLSNLSIEKWMNHFAEFCIEWFMNFFADPDYYWTLETYPGSDQKTNSSDNPVFAKVKKTSVHTFKKPVLRTNFSILKMSDISLKPVFNSFSKLKSDFLLFNFLPGKNFRAFRVFGC